MKKILLSGKMANRIYGNDGFVLVDDEDFDWLNQWKWHSLPNGYIAKTDYTKEKGRFKVLIHRLITNCPKRIEVDHKDGNMLNNQRHNLRLCTTSQNHANIPRSKNRVGEYKGVSMTYCGHIRARITFHQKEIWLGIFSDKISAAKAYDKKAKELFGEFAKLNFPESTLK